MIIPHSHHYNKPLPENAAPRSIVQLAQYDIARTASLVRECGVGSRGMLTTTRGYQNQLAPAMSRYGVLSAPNTYTTNELLHLKGTVIPAGEYQHDG